VAKMLAEVLRPATARALLGVMGVSSWSLMYWAAPWKLPGTPTQLAGNPRMATLHSLGDLPIVGDITRWVLQ
jgi:hypothetical protein